MASAYMLKLAAVKLATVRKRQRKQAASPVWAGLGGLHGPVGAALGSYLSETDERTRQIRDKQEPESMLTSTLLTALASLAGGTVSGVGGDILAAKLSGKPMLDPASLRWGFGASAIGGGLSAAAAAALINASRKGSDEPKTSAYKRGCDTCGCRQALAAKIASLLVSRRTKSAAMKFINAMDLGEEGRLWAEAWDKAKRNNQRKQADSDDADRILGPELPGVLAKRYSDKLQAAMHKPVDAAKQIGDRDHAIAHEQSLQRESPKRAPWSSEIGPSPSDSGAGVKALANVPEQLNYYWQQVTKSLPQAQELLSRGYRDLRRSPKAVSQQLAATADENSVSPFQSPWLNQALTNSKSLERSPLVFSPEDNKPGGATVSHGEIVPRPISPGLGEQKPDVAWWEGLAKNPWVLGGAAAGGLGLGAYALNKMFGGESEEEKEKKKREAREAQYA